MDCDAVYKETRLDDDFAAWTWDPADRTETWEQGVFFKKETALKYYARYKDGHYVQGRTTSKPSSRRSTSPGSEDIMGIAKTVARVKQQGYDFRTQETSRGSLSRHVDFCNRSKSGTTQALRTPATTCQLQNDHGAR